MAVTIIDVARAAGVSKTTASDALRGSGRVAPRTREAVVAAATALGFRANRSARLLRTATTGSVGLYLPQARVRSEYYLSFLFGVVNGMASTDYDVTVTLSGSRLGDWYEHAVDGVIVCDPRADDELLPALLDGELPVVSCEPMLGDAQPHGIVFSDPRRWFGELLAALAEGGATRPALLGTTTQGHWARGIHEAYADWCDAHGVDPALVVAPFGTSPSHLQPLVTDLVAGRPDVDALVCLGDAVAAAVAPALTAAGKRLGDDFLLASCSEQHLHPQVFAVIDTRGEAAGRACASLMLDLLDGRAAAGTRRELELEILRADRPESPLTPPCSPPPGTGRSSRRAPTAATGP